MIRVLIADDHAAIRAGLKLIFDNSDGIEVVGEASSGATAIRQARVLQPDVVLMDLRMPDTDGEEATRVLASEGHNILVLTTYDHDEAVFGSVRAGAAGFVLKTAESAELVSAVRRVASDEGALAPEVTRRVLLALSSTEPASESQSVALTRARSVRAIEAGGLTTREHEVLKEIGRGSSNTDIARNLGITVGTTKSHVSRILTKLEIESRTQAALLVRDAGFLPADPVISEDTSQTNWPLPRRSHGVPAAQGMNRCRGDQPRT
ncbi:response regulator [Nesterenkonia populi]